MGRILQGKCSHCAYHAELYLGGGLRDCNPETALAAVPENEELKQALDQGAMFRIEREIAVCDACKKLVTGTKVVYQHHQQEPYAESVCPKCHGPLRWPGTVSDSILCPLCGHGMVWDTVGHWD